MKIGYKKSTAEGLVTALQGAQIGAENYARGRRIKREQDQRESDSDRRYELGLKESARQDEANRRANEDAARDAELFPSRKRRIDAESEWYEKRTREEELRERASRQYDIEKYRRDMGKEPPDWMYGPDGPPPRPGEMGWHWSMQEPDMRSDVPVDVQDHIQRRRAEIEELGQHDPKRAAVELRALQDESKSMILERNRQNVQTQIERMEMPEEEAAGAEPDPHRFIDSQRANDWKEKLKNADQTRIDQVEDEIRKARKEHSDKLAIEDARGLALQRIDQHFQKIADMEAQFGEMGQQGFDPETWVAARSLRHQIEGDPLLSASGIAAREKDIIDMFSKRSKPGGGEGAYGKQPAPEQLYDTAYRLAASMNPKWGEMTPEQQDAETNKQLGRMYAAGRGFRGMGGEQPQAAPKQEQAAPEQTSKPSLPTTRQALDLEPAERKKRAPDAALAKLAGWTKEEWVKYYETGEKPKGKPLRR